MQQKKSKRRENCEIKKLCEWHAYRELFLFPVQFFKLDISLKIWNDEIAGFKKSPFEAKKHPFTIFCKQSTQEKF